MAIVHHHAALFGDAVHRQKPQVVRCELVFDARIAEPDDQFHAAYFFFSDFSAFSAFSPLAFGSFALGFLLALLDDFGLGSGRLGLGSFDRSGRNDFLHRRDVGNRLVLVGDELDLVAVRQVGNPNASVRTSNWLTSPSMWLGMSAGRHSISTSRIICSRMPPCTFTPGASPFSVTGTPTRKQLVHGNALQVNVQQRALNGVRLPVDDHRFARVAARAQVENGVVSGLGSKDALHLLGIDRDGQ